MSIQDPEPFPRDESELRAFLAAIVESSDDAIVGKGLDGVIRSWNGGAERLFGYTADEVIGRSITLIIPPDRHGEEEEILSRLVRGERIDHFETVRVAKDGHLVEVSITISPIHDAEGRVVGASKVARDIGERKRAEQALRDADRRKDIFLATLAHELRNPLAPIRSSIELLRLGWDPEVAGKSLQILERQTAQLERLVDDLLDISRITRGKVELRRDRVELASTVQTAIEASRPLLVAAQHRLIVDLPVEPVILDADPARLAQVFANLLNNAARYTPRGGEVRIAAELLGEQVVVSVTDSGEGIDSEMLEQIFDLFMQAGERPRRETGGLGIGLTLVRSLVELHGGSVEAESPGSGQGSTFRVRLPIAGHAEAPAEDHPTALPRPARSGARVLIADDNRDAADSLQALLAALGYDAHVAYAGDHALAAAAALRPDIALVDLGMPGTDGYETARRLRAQPWGEGIVLVALTGWSQESDQRRTRGAGFDHHLVKPASLDRLLAVLEAGSRGSRTPPPRD